jgi:predicted outer membrane protein
MSGDQTIMLSALQSLRGVEFDQAYARQQVLAHRQALAVADSYVKWGADANLRKAAQSVAALIQHHLVAAEHMRSALGGSWAAALGLADGNRTPMLRRAIR